MDSRTRGPTLWIITIVFWLTAATAATNWLPLCHGSRLILSPTAPSTCNSEISKMLEVYSTGSYSYIPLSRISIDEDKGCRSSTSCRSSRSCGVGCRCREGRSISRCFNANGIERSNQVLRSSVSFDTTRRQHFNIQGIEQFQIPTPSLAYPYHNPDLRKHLHHLD